MARQVIVSLSDDLDGTDATGTVLFGLDHVAYEIDLNDEHAKELRDFLAPFVGAARPAAMPGKPVKRVRKRNDTETQAIREWAKACGITISDRGRIPVNVVSRYRAGTVNGS